MASKHEPLPPRQVESTMDYAQHQATYDGFVASVKWAILIMAVSMIILYFLIIH